MKKYKNNINASSMADIAFLLLIFFLVSTTLDQDKGILNKLPQISKEKPLPLKDNNVLELVINSFGEVMLEGSVIGKEKVKEYAIKHILNFGKEPNFSDSPKKAVVLLETNRGASYDLYIQIHNDLKLAYNEIRNEQALKLSSGDYNYVELKQCIENAKESALKCKELKETIKEAYPMILIEK